MIVETRVAWASLRETKARSRTQRRHDENRSVPQPRTSMNAHVNPCHQRIVATTGEPSAVQPPTKSGFFISGVPDQKFIRGLLVRVVFPILSECLFFFSVMAI